MPSQETYHRSQCDREREEAPPERAGQLRTWLLAALVVAGLVLAWQLHTPAPGPIPPGPRYQRAPRVEGAYMNYAVGPEAVRDMVTIYVTTGLPVVTLEGRTVDNPVTIAQWGLQGFSRYVTRGDRVGLDDAMRAGEWLLAHQDPDGAWRFGFPYTVDPRAPVIPAGWVSGMAQGQAMSLLVRLWDHTGDPRFLDAAKAAAGPLATPIAEGGIQGRLNGGVWFEINPAGFHVLNAHMYTLVGLWDLAPHYPPAADLYNQGRATLEQNLRLWDRGERPPLYDLRHQQLDTRKYEPDYDASHEGLLLELLHHRDSGVLRWWLGRWF